MDSSGLRKQKVAPLTVEGLVVADIVGMAGLEQNSKTQHIDEGLVSRALHPGGNLRCPLFTSTFLRAIDCSTARILSATASRSLAFLVISRATEKKTAIPTGKEMISIRIDRDVLEYLQEDGAGWQERINAVLRSAAGLEPL